MKDITSKGPLSGTDYSPLMGKDLPPRKKTGVEFLYERFPQAIALWALKGKKSDEQTHVVQAFNVNGHIVLVQNWDTGWDMYVQASEVGSTAATLDAVERRVRV